MAEAANTRLIGHIDCAGGGQVWVDGETLYVGHMRAPERISTWARMRSVAQSKPPSWDERSRFL